MNSTEEDLCARYIEASAALQRGDLDGARRGFDLLLMDAPRFAAAWDGRGSCHAAEGDLKRAGECFQKAIRLERNNWRSRYNWGVALHRAGELREACKWLRAACKLAPGERVVHYRLGSCHSDLGEYEQALRCYHRALEQPEREVTDAELYLHIGNAEGERGEFEAAEKAYERACLFSPDDPMVFYNWATLSARQGDLESAERLALRARALDPRSLRCALLWFHLALDNGAWEAAETRIAELGRLAGSDRLSTALRAELARRVGNREAARSLAMEALVMEGPPSDHAVDRALATLRELRGLSVPCHGFRLLVGVDCGAETYFRPYVVLAQTEEQARWFVAELQDALDPSPWRIVESESFPHEGEAVAGVYHLLLTRVLFPHEDCSFVDPEHAAWR